MLLSFPQRAAWALLSVSSAALNPQINLGYATYEGTSLSNGVNQFLGMRYAAPPLKENRFKRAVAPLEETGIVMAKEVCMFSPFPPTRLRLEILTGSLIARSSVLRC